VFSTTAVAAEKKTQAPEGSLQDVAKCLTEVRKDMVTIQKYLLTTL
jgi:hypothetical protein